MKITYFKLVNFKNVLSAMNRHILEIDLSKSINRVVIILGENGSGKTTIMSQLHPFANNGNTDQRSIKELMIEGKEAYKEIHFLDGHDKYEVKHFYTKSGSVKSYISKNGKELNPNGNVTSFLECLYDEFTLATDFLNLLRLGSNDSNFIKMSATERKKYTTSLLDDVKVYAKLFKTVSDDLRALKSVLKNVADKINKLKVYSLKELENEIHTLSNTLEDNRKTKDDLVNERAVLSANISSILNSKSLEEILRERDETSHMIKSLDKSLQKLEEIDDVKNIEKELLECKEKLSKLTNEREVIISRESELVSRMTEYKSANEKFSLQLGNFNPNEVNRLKDLINKYEDRLATEFKGYDNSDVKYKSEDLKEALDLMKSIDSVCSLMIGFNNKAKKEIVELYLDNPSENHEKEIHVMHNNITSKLEKAKISKNNQVYKKKVAPAEMRFMFKPAGCQYNNCSMEAFYREITSAEEFDTKEIDKTIAKLERELEEIDDYYAVNSNISYIKMILDSNSKLIEKVPRDLFDFNKILHAIATETVFFNEEFVTKLINIADKHTMYTDILKNISDLKERLSIHEENSGAMMLIKNQMDENYTKLSSIDKELSELDWKKHKLGQDIEELTNLMEELTEFLTISKERDNMITQVNELKELQTKLIKDISTIESNYIKIKSTNNKIEEIDYKIRHNSDLLETLRRNLVNYKELTKEKEELEEKFEDLTVIREALSSTKGIPLLYMRIYMMDSLSQINELLDIVYDGTLEVQPFIIDEDSFKIPYTKNGINIPDVRSCSQGEETFLSMAISFAFISRSIDRYNIMLLDEIDAALDQRRRQSFLDTLEAQLNIINAEQVFMITHNNAFYDYPVDAIITSDINLDNYKNMNIIFNATA